MEQFLNTTTFHCLVYLNSKNTKIKLLWSILFGLSALGLLVTTIILAIQYFSYDDYIINNEKLIENVERIKNLVICQYDSLHLVESVLVAWHELNDTFTNVSRLIETMDLTDVLSFPARVKSLTLSGKKFDQDIQSAIIDEFVNSGALELADCYIRTSEGKIPCLNYTHYAFTLYGVCLSINLNDLVDRLDLFLNINKYAFYQERNDLIYVSLKSNNLSDKIHFGFIESHIETRFNNLKVKMLPKELHLQANKFMIEFEEASYSSSLYDIKCYQNNGFYSQQKCHFECLEMMIKKILDCRFSLSAATDDCPIEYLPVIEFIVKNYELINSELLGGVCSQSCLPECQSVYYNIHLMPEIGLVNERAFSFLFSFTNRVKIRHQMCSLEYSQFLNFLNGLWSLFLGISLLSFWELVEIAYKMLKEKVLAKYLEPNSLIIKKRQLPDSLNILKITYSKIEIAFRNTVLHGFKHIFKENDFTVKLRWTILIVLVSFSFYFSVLAAVKDYLRYQSSIQSRKLIIRSEPILKRNITVIMCTSYSIHGEYTDSYNLLREKANKQRSGNETHGLFEKYKEALAELVPVHTAETNNLMMEIYRKVFNMPTIKINLEMISAGGKGSTKLQMELETSLYFEKACYKLESLANVGDFYHGNGMIDIEANVHYLNGTNTTDQYFYISIVDSQSPYLSSNSWLKLTKFFYGATIMLRHSKYLPKPFESNCHDDFEEESEYNQHDCYLNCLNEIIEKRFNCSLIYASPNKVRKIYCHPLLMPFIEKYKIEKLNNLTNLDDCSQCTIPCHVYDYQLVAKMGISYEVFKFFFYMDGYLMEEREEVAIVTFYETIIVIISYLSLYFGGSLLALVQIPFNLISHVSCLVKAKASILNIKILTLIGSVTTFHCVNYLINSLNRLFQLFWLTMVIMGICLNVLYVRQEMIEYKRYPTKTKTIKQQIKTSTIEICTATVLDYDALYSYFYMSETFGQFESVFKKYFKEFIKSQETNECLDRNSGNLTCTLKDYFEKLYKNYTTGLVLNESRYKELSKYKLSEFVNYIHEIHLNFTLFTDDQFMLEQPLGSKSDKNIRVDLNLYHRGILYGPDFTFKLCKSINSNRPQNVHINSNPFDTVNRLQYNILFYRNPRLLQLFYDKTFVSSIHYREEVNLIRRIKITEQSSLIDKINNECKSELDNCLHIQHTLIELSNHNLFYCNTQFMHAFTTVFNCTPFFQLDSKSIKGVAECPLIAIPLINHIFSHFKNILNKCQFSMQHTSEVFYKELDTRRDMKPKIIINLDNIDTYEETTVFSYSFLKLISNFSNFSNITLGISILTFIEFIYLIFYFYHNQSSKIHP